MTNHKISMFRGDNEYRKYTIKDKTTGLALDIASSKIIFTVRVSDTDELLFQRKSVLAGGSDSEIEILTPTTNGQFRLKIEPINTVNITPGSYVFDIQITFSDGFVKTIVDDVIIIRKDKTI